MDSGLGIPSICIVEKWEAQLVEAECFRFALGASVWFGGAEPPGLKLPEQELSKTRAVYNSTTHLIYVACVSDLNKTQTINFPEVVFNRHSRKT